MKKLLWFLLLMVSGPAFSQVTITYQDYLDAFSPGTMYKSYSTPVGGPDVNVFVGLASATAQYWDFTGYSFSYMAKSTGIEPSAAPLLSKFPSSNLVLYEKSWTSKSDTVYDWNYKELQSDRLMILGVSDETSVILSYNPPAIHAMVPLAYGDSWMRERDSTFIMQNYYIITEAVVTVDAFGTMKLPSGEYSCLRLSENQLTMTHTPVSIDTTRKRSYSFYAKGIMEVNLPAITEDQFSSSTIAAGAVKYSENINQVGVPEKNPLSNGITLKQNTPNPFGQSTSINWQSAVNSYVVLKVFDCFGKEVRTLFDGPLNPGSHQITFDGTGLQPGFYFCKLLADGQTTVIKLIKSPQ